MTGPATDLFPPTSFVSTAGGHPRRPRRRSGRRWCGRGGAPGSFLVARGDGGAASPDREQPIEAHRISDANNVAGRVVVEPHGHVKIHLLRGSEAVQSARIHEMGGTSIHG